MMNYYDLIDNIYEGFFDTPMLQKITKELGKKLDKYRVTDAEREYVNKLLALPDARPYPGDGTLEAWLLRISLWGNIKITHTNPDENIKNERMSTDDLLDYTDDQSRNEVYGKWKVEYPKVNLVKFVRRFYSLELGKEVNEEIIVEIDLRDDLKQVLKQARKSAGLSGMFN